MMNHFQFWREVDSYNRNFGILVYKQGVSFHLGKRHYRFLWVGAW